MKKNLTVSLSIFAVIALGLVGFVLVGPNNNDPPGEAAIGTTVPTMEPEIAACIRAAEAKLAEIAEFESEGNLAAALTDSESVRLLTIRNEFLRDQREWGTASDYPLTQLDAKLYDFCAAYTGNIGDD